MARKGLWQSLVALSGWETYKAHMKHRFRPEPVDAARFNDPVALRASWQPLPHTGLLFPRRLRQQGSERCHFRLRRFFALSLFVAPQLLALVAYRIWFLYLALMAVGAALSLILWYLGSTPVAFDKRASVFCRGRGRRRQRLALSGIHALQLLSFFHSGREAREAGVVYQLNVVMEDGQRLEVVTQRMPALRASREALFDDAAQLARFLGVPLWDAIAEFDR